MTDSAELHASLEGKSILVTGGTGSIGSVIVQRILEHNPRVVRVLSNDEYGLFMLQRAMSDPRLRFLLGDVRDRDRMQRAMEGIDIVYHCAALKHVPLCEYNPFEAMKTNVLGTQNCIEAARDQGVERFILISTDKAVLPANTMGATKFLAERLLVDAADYAQNRNLTLASVRFGNVLFSRGSVLETFGKQVQSGGPVTITNDEMTRFFMPISRAVDLVFEATTMAQGGEVFILKMPRVKIGDLAQAVIALGGNPPIEVTHTGLRAGEKMHEDLMTSLEAQHALETERMFIVLPEWLGDEERTYTDASPVSTEDYGSASGPFISGPELEQLLEDARGDAHYEAWIAE